MASLLVALCATALAIGQTGSGCADATACNFDEAASSPIDSALCDYCGCPEVQVPTTAFFPSDSAGYGLRVNLVETHGPTTTGLEDLFGMRTFRVYAVAENPSAIVSAVSGSSVDGPLVCSAPEGYYQHPLGSLTGGGILSPLFSAGFPALQYDSWVTIGIDQESSALGDNFSSISTIAAPGEDWISTFEPGLGAPGSSFEATNSVGGGWFCIPTSDNCIPDPTGAVLLGQFTSGGDVSGSLTVQFQPMGAGQGDLNLNIAFSSSGLGIPTWTQPEDCPCASDTDSDGICAPFDACSDLSACNYSDPLNPPCAYLDACGTCGGLGIPSGACDCQGTLPDAVGVCGGDCPADLDGDGVCDDVDDCIGDLDACGICNGPGAVFSCGCDCIPVGDCDCEGNQLDALGECGGSCTADADGDGVCDDVDDCVGSLDACGVCNGPGEIYDCGCNGIPAGDCDCDGNQPDALGVCGGSCPADTDGDGVCDDAEVDGCTNPFACNYNPAATDDDGACFTEDAIGTCGGNCTADADGDGVCDDVDDCVGTLDACGVCNGPGSIYDCGCSGIPAGDCDCDGNQPDALGECGGLCPADTDGDGLCDDAEVGGCTNTFACNYSPAATDDDGSCLTADVLGDCGGSCTADADGDGVCDDVDDCVGTLDACGVCNGPGGIYDCGCTGMPAGDCDCNGSQADALGECGGNCTADADGDGFCDDVDDCVGALDACGVCNGPGEIYDCGCSDIPAEDCDCDGNQLDALGECGGPCSADTDGDGVCDDAEVDGCSNPFACNYSAEATDDDGSCLTEDAIGDCGGDCTADADGDGVCDDVDDCVGSLDACGVCNGPGEIYDCGCTGIPAGDCDCNGNQPDALGVCGGSCIADTDSDGVCDDAEVDGCTNPFACNYSAEATDDDASCLTEDAIGVCGGDCTADADGDGVCDDLDDCVGALDACGVCNGPGEIYDCGCSDIPAGDCDCDGNQPDALGECGGGCSADTDGDDVCDDAEVDGCTNPFACNYSAAATDNDGSCLTEDAIGVCGGDCTADADGDGVCDDVDDCVGSLDACGVCNGPGEIFDCGCSDIPAGDCDCDGNQPDALGECGGPCPVDTDGDGVCDDAEVDGCTNPFACNYSAAATDDDGSCLTEDAIGVCGGDCTADADGDGICDNETECVGTVDACGVCNGPGAIFDCGCAGTPIGDCDCNGNQLDAVGVCGGSCTADADGDGVCDDVDDCVGTLDACGVCNGPGEIYDCGCSGIPAGDCDCDGNQIDALGVCGGPCSADTDGDGVCDDAEVDGCTNPFACNYNAAATDDDGSCLTADVLGECGGSCTADADGDGVCDDVDDCVGTLDACGVCNGPGDIYDCGCSGIPAGDCDCDGNQIDALGVCGGPCSADTDGDGVCDDAEVDGCTNPFACNYNAAATDDDGSCLTADVLGECGGSCTADADGDGVCDDVDDCVGVLDACGVCNGPGEVYDCGCSDIPAGDCDCDGNQIDALGVCGGPCLADTDGDGVCDDAEVDGCTNPFACNYSPAATDDDGSCLTADVLGECGGSCTADADGDGVCDDVDDCLGALDACGVCNGPGEVYDCGCSDVPAEDCDCDGNQLDAIGECGGSCSSDTDGDGVCDSAEVYGCTDSDACNYADQATEDNSSCFYFDALGICGGNCEGDEDNDGICDSEDTCFGTLDVCGVCNGPGAIYECACQDIEPGTCDCDGNVPDAIGVCDGECEEDDNQNGICDDIEDSLCGPGSIWSASLGLCVGVSGDCPTDLDNNGSTGSADLLIFLTEFGTECSN